MSNRSHALLMEAGFTAARLSIVAMPLVVVERGGGVVDTGAVGGRRFGRAGHKVLGEPELRLIR